MEKYIINVSRNHKQIAVNVLFDFDLAYDYAYRQVGFGYDVSIIKYIDDKKVGVTQLYPSTTM